MDRTSIEDPFCKLEKGNQIWNKFKPKQRERAEDDVDWLESMIAAEWERRQIGLTPPPWISRWNRLSETVSLLTEMS